MKNFLLFCFLILFFSFSPLFAQKYADILMDAETGEILHQVDADGHRFPASLTKMMTLYVIFSRLRAKKIRMDTQFSVPHCATTVEPSKLGLRNGQRISVKEIVLGLITKSANDAAVTAAVGISGSITAFSRIMNDTAHTLGMKRSHFYNPNGLPDARQLTTAKDMALLSRALVHHFPEYYKLFKTRIFTFMGHCHANHNRLLGQVEGLDGIKTGWFRRAGSNLAASALRIVNGKPRRLIAVVLGGENRFARDERIKELLVTGFAILSKSNKLKTEQLNYPKKILTSTPLIDKADPIGDLIHKESHVQNKRIQQTENKAKNNADAPALPSKLSKIGRASCRERVSSPV